MHARTSLLFVALAGTAALTAEALAAAPHYQMVLDAAQATHGVTTVSLVANPAIQRGWVALSAVEAEAPRRVHLSEAGQRQVLTGPALIPGQKILRLDAQGQPYYISFDAATIAATARQYALQARHTSSNQDHATALEGNVVDESWLIADPACDKALALGLTDLPAGTWMLSMHIPDATYWQSEVVSGNKQGFSIEGFFDTQQLTLSAPAPASTPAPMNWYQKICTKLSALGKKEAAELRLALGLEQLADGRAVHIDDTTGAVTVCAADGTPGEALPDGTYPLQNGGELVVQGGMRQEGEGKTADAPVAAAADEQAAAPAAPAPLPADATTAQIVDTLNKLLETQGGEKKPDPATQPAGQKLAATLHGVKLDALGEKLTELKLDAIELDGGDKLTYNAVSRRLSDSKNALVESGYYACADGSYIQVSTSQYIWEIDKQTYDTVYGAKLQAVELADLRTKLASQPAAGKVHMSTVAEGTESGDKPKSRIQLAREVAEATK